jgi:diguanylate cyclase (GGDEF)-like protein
MPKDHETTMWTIESYARIAALWMHDPAALDGLAEAARRDSLTGVLNYGAARAELAREVSRASRHRLEFSCCFLDLDGFKQINDLHGHLHGNTVLSRVAATLRSSMREFDILGRFGGDEFIVILPETDASSARAMAERLRLQVAGATSSVLPLTASIGVAAWAQGMTADGLLAAADEALAAAKNAGGGVVVAAADLA